MDPGGRLDLGGQWRAALSTEELQRSMADPDLDDAGWAELVVPGHWRSHPEFRSADGPLLYRRPFRAPAPGPGRRLFLTFDGIFYQADVWLDGGYLGDTEGYFFPHTFEITEPAGRGDDHVLAVEVACHRPGDLRAKRNLTGVFQHWDCIDPDWNPGGIWAPVHVHETGPVRLRRLTVLCREASEEVAVLDVTADLDAGTAGPVALRTRIGPEGRPGDEALESTQEHALALGDNHLTWRVGVTEPDLWWPHALGAQPLYTVEVVVDAAGATSDRRTVTTGLRRVTVRDFVATVNGERMFLKGANCGPTRRALAEATPDELAGDVAVAKDAGLDLLRVHAHITRPELYDAADRAGMLIWQDLPLQWGYRQVRRQAVAQAREAVAALGHHPSIALWCGHNEPIALDATPEATAKPSRRTAARFALAQVLPSWNKTVLDRWIRRSLERADGSREVVAHSGVLPHPAWGTDSHLYYGWYYGDEREFPAALARLPVLARFVSEFGAQAVPETADFLHPEGWPDLDWEDLEAHHCLQRGVFETRVPPSDHPTFEGWQSATQQYQATLLRHHIETLRRLKYRPTGGFCVFLLADAQPAVTWSLLDHERRPKAGYRAVAEACAPVIVTADRPAPAYPPGGRIALDVHVVSDLRRGLGEGRVRAEMRWPGGRRVWSFAGEIPADSCVRVGRVDATLPDDAAPGKIELELVLRWDGSCVTRSYTSAVDG